MSIIPLLASSLGRRDEAPNQALAASIAREHNTNAVDELAQLLQTGNKDQQSDVIKVLDEIGKIDPELLAPHLPLLLGFLSHKNNRLVWGAMAAIHSLADRYPAELYKVLPTIVDIGNKGSVITRDHAVGILVSLCRHKKYAGDAFQLLNEQLMSAPTNQLPMYAEQAADVIPAANRSVFVATLRSRLNDIDKDTKRKRVEKVIRRLELLER